MPETNPAEIWNVEVNGTVYEAVFSELPDWIDGGSLLPTDKVRKGNLRWVEARRVPSLIPFFNAKERGEPMPVVVTTTAPERAAMPSVPEAPHPKILADIAIETVPEALTETPAASARPVDPDHCAQHPELASVYLCQSCLSGFCKTCPRSYGGSVRICPMCGSLCSSVQEAKAIGRVAKSSMPSDRNFGFSDLAAAFAHPFRFKVSLLFGAAMFAFFTVGQAAASMGGIFLFVSALFCLMLSNMLTFGVLSNTVERFIQGDLDANFMPDFENFEIWDDVVHPFFLSIGAYVSSFGPFLLTLAVGFYLVTSAVTEQANSIKSDLERIPGTEVYAGRELADQSGDVKEVLERIDKRQAERLKAATQRATVATESAEADTAPSDLETSPPPAFDEESREQEELWAAATESRRKSLESAIGKTPETREQEQEAMIGAFLRLAAPLVVIGFITFLWGAMFFPAACIVAGFSRSFVSTINPFVGLDTIRRLGFSYIKVLLMGLLLVVIASLIGGVISALFSPFDLPALGNLPAKGISAFFTFYLWAVFSCVLGYLLYKKADQLSVSH